MSSEFAVNAALTAREMESNATNGLYHIGKLLRDGTQERCRIVGAKAVYKDEQETAWQEIETECKKIGCNPPQKSKCVKAFALITLSPDCGKLAKSVVEQLMTLVRVKPTDGAAQWGKYESETKKLVEKCVSKKLTAAQTKAAVNKIKGTVPQTVEQKARAERERMEEQTLEGIETLDVMTLARMLTVDPELVSKLLQAIEAVKAGITVTEVNDAA